MGYRRNYNRDPLIDALGLILMFFIGLIVGMYITIDFFEDVLIECNEGVKLDV